jgi:hypothetical protein
MCYSFLLSWTPHKIVIKMILFINYHHHQPINIPTTWAQAFLIIKLHIRRPGHNPPRWPSSEWWVQTTANAAETNGLTCFPKHGRARDNKFLVTHPMTDQRCLTSWSHGEAHSSRGHRAPHLYKYKINQIKI